MELRLLKCHGSGNDFLLIDEMKENYSFTENDRQMLARILCDRRSQLGADGILFVSHSECADAKMRVFNADGSEASMCGNGLRCVARYVCESLNKPMAIIETMKANLTVEKGEDIYPQVPTYAVEISPVSFKVKDLPLAIDKEILLNGKLPSLSEELIFSAVAVPNPHLITIVNKETLHSDIQKRISEYVNGENELFPDGVNVSFVKIIEEGKIFVRTFERGVGFTNACGTAMSASTLITCLNGFNKIESPVEVFNNGGKVRCVVHKNNSEYKISLIGNATFEYSASIDINLTTPPSFTLLTKNDFTLEANQYVKLEDEVKNFLEHNL